MASRKEREMTAADARRSERERREKAQSHRGKVVRGSARPIPSRSVPQMVSVRLDPQLVGELRSVAERRGTTLSEVLREAAASAAAHSRSIPVEWKVSTIEVTGPSRPIKWSESPTRAGIRLVPDAAAAG